MNLTSNEGTTHQPNSPDQKRQQINLQRGQSQACL